MSLVINKLSAKTGVPAKVSRRSIKVSCKSFDINSAIEKRKELDKKRLERVKEIGNTLDNIARSEVKHTAETLQAYFPFISNLKDFKGVTKDDLEKFFKSKTTEQEKKAE